MCPLCSRCPHHPLIDDSVWHFDSLCPTHCTQDLTPGICLMSSCALALGVDPLPLTEWDHLATSYEQGSVGSLYIEQKYTFKGAAPPSDGHGNLVMAMGTRFGHDPQAFPRNAVVGMLFYSTFSHTACAFGPYCLLCVTITQGRRVALFKREAVLSRTYCLWTTNFPGQFWLHFLKSSPVSCRLHKVGDFISFLCFLRCLVQCSAGGRDQGNAVGNAEAFGCSVVRVVVRGAGKREEVYVEYGQVQGNSLTLGAP